MNCIHGIPKQFCTAIHDEDLKMLMMVAARDGRTMNHMEPMAKIVHARLDAWARWAYETLQEAPQCNLGRVIKYGPLGAAQEGRPPISMPDEIAAVDAAIARLVQIDQRAIKEYYLRWQPVEVAARRMHKSVRQFQAILRRARWRLGVMLQLI